jgi:hypothetical protein
MRRIFQSAAQSVKELQKQGQALLDAAKNEHKKHPYIATGVLATLTFASAFGIVNGVSQLADKNTREDFVTWSICSYKQKYNTPCSADENATYAVIEQQEQRKAYGGSALSLIVGFGAGALHRRRLSKKP